MVRESWHGERTGESLHAGTQTRNLFRRLCIFKQETLKVCQFFWSGQKEKNKPKGRPKTSTSELVFDSSIYQSLEFQVCIFLLKHWSNLRSYWWLPHIMHTLYSLVFVLTSSAILMPSSMKSTTFSKSASLNWRDVSAGVPVTRMDQIKLSEWRTDVKGAQIMQVCY